MRRRAHHAIPLVRLLASAFLFALLLTLAGCGTDPLVSPYTGTPTDAQRETLREMETRMAQVRGLEPLRETEYAFVSRGLLDRAVEDYRLLGARGLEEFDIKYTTQPIYELLGFIAPGDDLIELRARLSASAAAAFYDPGWYTVVLVDDHLKLDTSTEVILAHEFVHALQDHHFDFNNIASEMQDDWDASFAFRALIEGDATVAMQQYAPMSTSLTGPPAAESTYNRFPDALRKEFAFPYEAGVAFVEALRAKGGWQAVNDAYAHPPTTSEQVLHPEKYLAGETGEEIVLGYVGEAFGGRSRFTTDGGLGEFLLRTHLEEELDKSEAANAAAGWGGDHWSFYSDEAGGKLLHLVIEWDAPEELDEFFGAYLKWLDAASEGTSQVLGADAAVWHGDERSVYVGRRDGRATVLISSDREVLDEARKNLGLP